MNADLRDQLVALRATLLMSVGTIVAIIDEQLGEPAEVEAQAPAAEAPAVETRRPEPAPPTAPRRIPIDLPGNVVALEPKRTRVGRPMSATTREIADLLDNLGRWMTTAEIVASVDADEEQIRRGLKTLFANGTVAKRPAAGAHGAQALAVEWGSVRLLKPMAVVAQNGARVQP